MYPSKYDTYNSEKGQLEQCHIMHILFLKTDQSIEIGLERHYIKIECL